MPSNDPTLKVSRFRGVSNTTRPTRMANGYLVAGENVDVDDEGGLELRSGYVAVPGFTAVTSAYATRDQTRLYVVDNGDLKRVISMSPLVTEVLASGIPNGEIYWTEGGNHVFYSGAAQGIVVDNVHLSAGIATAPGPGLTRIEGSLPAGQYQVACVFQDSTGREGGAGASSVIEVTDNSGLAINVPTLANHSTMVYVSSVNGDVLYLLEDDADDIFYWYGAEPSTFALDAAQQGTYPPPDNASCTTFFESRLWVADYLAQHDTTYLFHSQPFWYHLFDLSEDYLPIPGRVILLGATPQGLIIGTTRELYAYTEGRLDKLADHGAVEGHGIAYDQNDTAFFWTQRGVCTAFPFKNLTDDTYSVPPGTRAGVAILEQDGRNSFVAVTRKGGTANNPY